MREPASGPAFSPGFQRTLVWLASAGGGLLLALLLFSPARQAMEIQLDSSNYGSYSYFTAKNFQYGTEVVPMAGPYGFVPYGFTYSGQLFLKRLGLEFFTKLVLAGLIVWFFRRASARPVLRIFWLLLVMGLSPLISDMPYTLAILLSGLGLAQYHLAPGRRTLAICCGLAGYLALLTLFKGTQTMLAMATFGLLFLQALRTRNFRRLPWIAAAYSLALLGLLAAAGQNPLNVFHYLRGVMELSSGYNSAMGLDEPRVVFFTGLAVLVGLEGIVLSCLWPRWRDPVALAGGLFFAGFSFIAWKHGFVRADGHVFIYFQYACVAVPTILLFLDQPAASPVPRWSRLATGGLALIALVLSFWSDGNDPMERYRWSFGQFQQLVPESLRQLAAPAQAKARLDAAIDKNRGYYQLPRFRRIVGPARIDFFGLEQGYLMLNRFNYQPRPMGGGAFNVFTPWLSNLNVACLLDPARRPEYFLVNLETIDDRLLAQDDAGTLRALLANYTPVETGSDLALFRANPGPPHLPEPVLIRQQPLAWNQTVTLPAVRADQMLLVSFTLPLNLAGRARAALYKPPLVFMDLEGAHIYKPHARRIIPAMVLQPVPLNPVIEETADLIDLYQDKPGKVARTLCLKTAGPEYFAAGGMTVSFYAAPRPAPAPPPPLLLENALVSKVNPFMIEALNAPMLRDGDMVAQMLVPPARMGYELTGDETQVVFSYGMAPAVYTLPTDGVDIMVDLERPGQPSQKIFHKSISPRYRAADRGKHNVHLPLPPFPPGSKLYLRVDPGPARDGAWDLAYFTDIDFIHGPYIPGQFPGFATLPISVDAGVCGRLENNGHDVFMLNSPGSVTFRLTGQERRLHFTGGMLPGAYTNGGNTDGVEFQVDLIRPDGSVKRLLTHYLNPLGNAADRADRAFDVPIPPAAAGARLILRITPGPFGNPSWDWSYINGLRFE